MRETIWMYWEGPLPGWIAHCMASVSRHNLCVQLLGPTAFGALRRFETDIELSRLHVAHRSDFIRLYLLRYYGGIWVDADCLALKPFDFLFEQIRQDGVTSYRQQGGEVANNLIGCESGFGAICCVYAEVCERLRSHKPLNWTSLGSQPLTTAFRAVAQQAINSYELFEPISWKSSHEYLIEASDAIHETRLNRSAYCYMLSNQSLTNSYGPEVHSRLIKPSTFFSFLVRNSAKSSGDDDVNNHQAPSLCHSHSESACYLPGLGKSERVKP